MVRNRVIEAMKSVDDWRVESQEKIVRRSDGLWLQYNSSSDQLHVGNEDHGVAQIVLDTDRDPELTDAFFRILNFHPSSNRKRSVLANLGIKDASL